MQQYPEQTSEIMLYDSAKASNSIWLIYNQAKQDQADLIIGPLQKHYIDQLLSSPILPVPLITLNYSNQNRESANRFELIEFGLRPEDEANQIATASAQHNYLKTIAIVPLSNFGQRMLTTYQQKIEQLGGEILAHEKYSRKQKDFSRTIKQLIGINKSQSRFNRLKQITGKKFEFEPRIRQDIDNIFLVADSKQAKLIIPQFKFFHAGSLPIFSNSQVYSKRSKKHSDLNDVKFTTPPWTFATNNKITNTRYQNFNALGQDSFNILSHLSRIKRNPNYTFNGAIGTISLDDVGRLHHKLEWATIKRGKLTRLDINAIE
jgi:outer membrane PBP1 activator LpoA protein